MYSVATMKKKLLYWVPTLLLLFVMLGSAVSYLLDTATAMENFELLGYPGYSMYANATAKILGAVALLVPAVPKLFKEWAYAGYLFILVLAAQALYLKMPAMAPTMLAFVVLWGLSYWQFKKQA